MADINARATLRVSVIIPTYNRAAYLQEALASVFAQRLAPWEVIVIDDGSTDNTEEIVATYDTRLRYFRQAHQGVAAARNYGLKVAQGEVIAWLDSDDLWESGFLSTIVPLLAADPELDGVYSGYTQFDDLGNTLPQSSHIVARPSELFSSLLEHNFIATPAIVLRKRCFEQVGDFNTQLSIGEDYDMWLRLTKSFTIMGLSTPLVKIRIHDSNTVRDTAAFCRFRLAVVQKHFGTSEGDPSTWTEEKRRAYALAFREVAIRYGQDEDPAQKWRHLERAIAVWPELLNRLDTFYELVCNVQPRGYRGDATSLDIEGNGAEILGWLDDLFIKTGPAFDVLRHNAYGNAYLALAMLSDQADRWGKARHYMMRAVGATPSLLASYQVLRRLVKLFVGRKVVNIIKSRRDN